MWTDLLKNYTTFTAAGAGRTLLLQARLSGSAQRQQRDLWRDANPHREAEGSEPAVHIERSLLQTVPGRGASMAVHRQVIKSGDERRNQARRADAVIHNLKLYLPAVRVPSQAKFDAQLGGALE